MTQDPARKKMVKLVIQRDAQLRNGTVATPGQTVEVDEEEAKELLSFCVEGSFDFSGERDGIQLKHKIRKAVLYREESAAQGL